MFGSPDSAVSAKPAAPVSPLASTAPAPDATVQAALSRLDDLTIQARDRDNPAASTTANDPDNGSAERDIDLAHDLAVVQDVQQRLHQRLSGIGS